MIAKFKIFKFLLFFLKFFNEIKINGSRKKCINLKSPNILFKFNYLNTTYDKFIICVDEYAPLLFTLTLVVLPFSKFVTSSIDGNGSDL